MPAPARIWLGSCAGFYGSRARPSARRSGRADRTACETAVSRTIGYTTQASISTLTHGAQPGIGVPDNKSFLRSDTVFNADTTGRDEPHGDLPSTIGKYVILERLGDGATSEVFRAHDDFNKRDVAIKRLRL